MFQRLRYSFNLQVRGILCFRNLQSAHTRWIDGIESEKADEATGRIYISLQLVNLAIVFQMN